MRNYIWYGMILSTLLPVGCRNGADVPSLDILRDGHNLQVLFRGASWRQGPGYWEGSGILNEAYAGRWLEEGDFSLNARLALQRVDSSTALFLFFGNHFGFDASNQGPDTKGRLFFYSPKVGKVRYFAPARNYLTPGRPFDFSVLRRDTLFTFFIDHVEVARIGISDLREPAAGYVGFRPWSNAMRLYHWTLEGRTSPVPPLDFVFARGEGGYACFRIPAIVETKSGQLLAFAEARRTDCHTDVGDIDLVLKRSSDGGRTWGDLEMIWDDGFNTCSSPAPVVERESGAVVLLACHSLGIDDPGKIMQGEAAGERRIFLLRSLDEGRSWSTPEEITSSIAPPEDSWYATGPGSAIQLRQGTRAGRMAAAAYYVYTDTVPQSVAHSIYSDDRGQTWHRGSALPEKGVSEAELAELSDGTLLINMRNGGSARGFRQIARSYDAGESWTGQQVDSALVEPNCQGSLYFVTEASALLFSNPADGKERRRLMVRRSPDGGKSWPDSLLLHPGPAAYSDLIGFRDMQLGCLFECGNVWPYEGIAFRKFGLPGIH